MGDVVNLNRFRKAKEKAAREAQAAANRTRYGRTKDQRAREKDEACEGKGLGEVEGHRVGGGRPAAAEPGRWPCGIVRNRIL